MIPVPVPVTDPVYLVTVTVQVFHAYSADEAAAVVTDPLVRDLRVGTITVDATTPDAPSLHHS